MADDHRELEPGMFECHPLYVITIAIALAGQLASEIKHKPTASGQGLTVPRWYVIMLAVGGASLVAQMQRARLGRGSREPDTA